MRHGKRMKCFDGFVEAAQLVSECHLMVSLRRKIASVTVDF